LGRVNRPGAFPIVEGGLTVIQAVTLAGGFQRIASREGTIVIRDPAGGERETFSVPVKSIVNDQRRRDFKLKPGDIVYVPEGIF
ncbi:MAG: SLBB domain-containing protein, partial [Planctomycetota bacterium]|nr:SLBB domain-containing protein [Planctomycetota bacterium]